VVAAAGSRAALDVIEDCISNLLRQRQPNLISSLPRHPQRAGLPLDIGNAKPRYITGPKPEPRQQQEDRAITTTLR
jgi:hypothetical protein